MCDYILFNVIFIIFDEKMSAGSYEKKNNFALESMGSTNEVPTLCMNEMAQKLYNLCKRCHRESNQFTFSIIR